jgi:hypothetical protein
MSNTELGKALSGQGELHEGAIDTLKHAIDLLEGKGEERFPPYEKEGAIIMLSKSLPVLYDPDNDENCELFRRGCRAIMSSFSEHESHNKMKLFISLTLSMNRELFDYEEALYLETIEFLIKLYDDEQFRDIGPIYGLVLTENIADAEVVYPEGYED